MVVATFGEFDEDAIKAGTRLGLPYVGLVASARRAGQVLSELRARGLGDGELAVVRSPAGLPLGTSGQEGISLSIMAEISSLRAESRPSFSERQRRRSTVEPDEAVDPVCGWRSSGFCRHVDEHEAPATISAAPVQADLRAGAGKYAFRVSLR